jgi:hypothetical protein
MVDGSLAVAQNAPVRHAIGSIVVALFALVFLHGGWAIRLLNPELRRADSVAISGRFGQSGLHRSICGSPWMPSVWDSSPQ